MLRVPKRCIVAISLLDGLGALKMRMGTTHFLTKRLPKVATKMALHVLAPQSNACQLIAIITYAVRHQLSLSTVSTRGTN